jgi:hypothetical protein
MTVRGRFVVVWVAALVACGGVEPPNEQPRRVGELLPVPAGRTEWMIVDGPVEHTSGTLYEYLDGGAERFLANGFRTMVHARYQLGPDRSACVTLDVYDMGTELGAFGIYSAGRGPEDEARPWGAESYRSGTVVAACSGPIFVHGEADADEPELMAFLEDGVAEVCGRAPGTRSRPRIVDLLPVDGLVVRSERYVPADLLGHSFLPGGLLATYEVDGRRSELYLSDLGSDATAAAALDRLQSHVASRGRVDDEVPELGDQGFRYEESAVGGGTVIRVGHVVVGIQGGVEAGPREDILRTMVGSLGRGIPDTGRSDD